MKTAAAHDFASFRSAARPLLAARVPPELILWSDGAAPQRALFDDPESSEPPLARGAQDRVPRRFLELARYAACHRSPERFDLLYRVLFRLTAGAQGLLDDPLDSDVRLLEQLAEQVRHDEHRMHAFLRFHETTHGLVAWYEPDHHVLRLVAPFFVRRMPNQRWAILTPGASVHYDARELSFGPGAPRSAAPRSDELEEVFRTYYAATYNPARTNLQLFEQHVPRRFQKQLPELSGVTELARRAMLAPARDDPSDSAAALVPSTRELPLLRAAARECRACPLGASATQTVFGTGAEHARLVLVGEQPGDEEDLSGQPFVGPAGKVLDRALLEAGVPRGDVYLTNAVKHFGFEERGKRRLHAKPKWRHVAACRPWLQAELQSIRPSAILCLGATAAQSFLGPRFSVNRNRGRVFETPWARSFLVTFHPSHVLRAASAEQREHSYTALVTDLRRAHQLARER